MRSQGVQHGIRVEFTEDYIATIAITLLICMYRDGSVNDTGGDVMIINIT